MVEKFFVTSIGTSRYEETEYYLEKNKDKKYKTKFTSVAIKNLIDDLKTARTYLFLTKEAISEHKKELEKETDVTCCEIEFPNTERKFWNLFCQISDKIPQNAQLYLDITNAFRSLPFVFFGIIQYLAALKNVQIKGIFYAVYEKQKTTPILNLISMKEMIDWFYAAEIFNNYGVSHLISKNFVKLQAQIYSQSKENKGFKELGKLFDNVSYGVANVDTLQLADAASDLLEKKITIEKKLEDHLPVAKDLINKMFALYEKFTYRDRNEKILDEYELNREKNIINWYLKHNQVKNALTLINEWLINKAIVLKGKQESWLDYRHTREPIGKELKNICRAVVDSKNSNEGLKNNFSKKIIDIMSVILRLSDLRNELSHGGYRQDKKNYAGMKDKINNAWEKVQDISDDDFKCIFSKHICESMTTWFVTRHSGAREWAEEQGFHVDCLLTHFNPEDINEGDLVLGTLPVNLAAEVCNRRCRYFHLSMDIPFDLRGSELDKNEMKACNARLEEYYIKRERL